MERTVTIATLAAASMSVALAAPASAEPANTGSAPQAGAIAAELAAVSTEAQARQHLAHQGYVGISTLDRDENGRWVGTAVKDGKTVFVAIDLPHTGTPAAN